MGDDKEKEEEKEEMDQQGYLDGTVYEEEADHTDHRQEKRSSFVLGLLCGVTLVLAMLGIMIGILKVQLEKRTSRQIQTQEDALSLDYSTLLLKLQTIQSLINEYSIYQTDVENAEEKIYDGMLESLDDPYSVYYTAQERKEMEESTSGEYSGIGAVLQQDKEAGTITIIQCFAGSPAEEAGLEYGDQIVKVNEYEVAEMDISTVVAKIRTEEGDTVRLTILRGEEELEFDLVRRNVEVPTVEYEMLENQVGYLRISEFDLVTVAQFETAMKDLESQGMEKLVIDLRDNPGGVLQVVVEILDQILPEGLIVYVEDKYGNREDYMSDEEHKLTIPLAVLINGNSASASEIFAGAVKDYGIGTLVGETTFGKGIVQNTFPMTDGTSIKLTIAKYYTPEGHDIHQIGVEPDIEIAYDAEGVEEYSKETDNQLQKAIGTLLLSTRASLCQQECPSVNRSVPLV